VKQNQDKLTTAKHISIEMITQVFLDEAQRSITFYDAVFGYWLTPEKGKGMYPK